jgi:hypothetical protein
MRGPSVLWVCGKIFFVAGCRFPFPELTDIMCDTVHCQWTVIKQSAVVFGGAWWLLQFSAARRQRGRALCITA